MIIKEDRDYIISLVKEFLPSVLEEVGFDPTVKEPGHSYGEKVEEVLASKLIKRDRRFALPVIKKGKGKQTRKMQDITFNDYFVNIKFGYKKKGQPNMVSFNRLSERYVNKEIDSYWILSIDGKDNNVCLFNLYEHLDYTNTNLGTGQVMLSESKFYPYFNQDKDYTITRKDVIMKLKKISQDATESHVKLRLQQEEKRQEMFNAHL